MSPAPIKPNPLLLPVSTVTGIIVGVCVFLAAKVYHPPPVNPLDVDYWDLLGTAVPQVELTRLDGKPLSSQVFRGQAHLLFFGTAGCAACDEVYPVLKEAAARMPVLMVAVQGLAEMKAKAVAEGFAFSVVYDSLEVLVGPLHVGGYPTAMWIDAAGRIVKAAGGNRSAPEVMRLALASLNEGDQDGRRHSQR